jgi:hypothetical protein
VVMWVSCGEVRRTSMRDGLKGEGIVILD